MHCLCFDLLVAAASATSASRVRGAVREILADERYQTAFPGHDAGPPMRLDGELFEVPSVVGTISQMLLWAAVVVAAVVLLTWIARSLGGRRATASAAEADALEPGVARASGATADDEQAKELARQGRYGEAIHVLLLCAISRLQTRKPEAAPPSYTSRELASGVAMSPEARATFGRLLLPVERAVFGGYAADAGAWDRGLADYQAFVAELRRPA